MPSEETNQNSLPAFLFVASEHELHEEQWKPDLVAKANQLYGEQQITELFPVKEFDVASGKKVIRYGIRVDTKEPTKTAAMIEVPFDESRHWYAVTVPATYEAHVAALEEIAAHGCTEYSIHGACLYAYMPDCDQPVAC